MSIYGNSYNMALIDKQIQSQFVWRRLTRLVDGKIGLDHGQMLVSLKLPSLAYQRKRGQLIRTVKILHDIHDTDQSTFFDVATTLYTRGHNWMLSINQSRLNAHSNFFSVRVVNAWNSLPSEVVNLTYLNRFKYKLDRPILLNNSICNDITL